MASIKTTIQIEITTKTPFEVRPKTEALKELSNQDNQTLRSVLELLKLDKEAFSNLMELSKSSVAVENLKSNFDMIKGFLGI